MIDLPNDNWVRSPKQPNWALCLDPAAKCFGWKMYENVAYQQWATGTPLTPAEVDKALLNNTLQKHWPQLKQLRDRLMDNAAGEKT